MVSGPAPLNPASHDPLGDRLKCFFDGVTSGPMPDRLVRLAAELEAALDRGDIGCAKRPGRSPRI